MTNATVAAGMITGREPTRIVAGAQAAPLSSGDHRITRMEQQSHAGHRAGVVWLDATAGVAFLVERFLFDAGFRVHVLAASEAAGHLGIVLRTLNDAGVLVVVYGEDAAARAIARHAVGPDCFLYVDPELIRDTEDLGDRVHTLLQQQGFVSAGDQQAN